LRTDMILLVDDNPDDVFLTVHAFRQNGIQNEIIVATDGIGALDLLHPTGTDAPLRPAIVLLDINMPRMGGLELLARLRSDPRTRSLPVIMLTTSTEDQDIAESYSTGANSYVAKPVTSDEFLEAARTMGLYWLGLNLQTSPLANEPDHCRPATPLVEVSEPL
jgi:two-component system response regulator